MPQRLRRIPSHRLSRLRDLRRRRRQLLNRRRRLRHRRRLLRRRHRMLLSRSQQLPRRRSDLLTTPTNLLHQHPQIPHRVVERLGQTDDQVVLGLDEAHAGQVAAAARSRAAESSWTCSSSALRAPSDSASMRKSDDAQLVADQAAADARRRPPTTSSAEPPPSSEPANWAGAEQQGGEQDRQRSVLDRGRARSTRRARSARTSATAGRPGRRTTQRRLSPRVTCPTRVTMVGQDRPSRSPPEKNVPEPRAIAVASEEMQRTEAEPADERGRTG